MAKKKATKKAAPKKKATKKVVAKKATKKVVAKAKKAAPKKVAKPAKKKTARKPNAAFMKPLTPSPALAAVVGTGQMPRTEVVKRIWEYIRKHNCQNPANKRNILADDKLEAVFGKKEVTMFELASLVGKHLS
ncbi:MAG: SWIB/MDM2 domain-containing protein [Bdellovibrionota bacterium]